jgi:hypothetical protein
MVQLICDKHIFNFFFIRAQKNINIKHMHTHSHSVAYPAILGGYKNSVEDREQREWGSGGGSPQSGVPLNLQMSETRILIRLLRMYFLRNREFGLAWLCQYFGISGRVRFVPPLRYATPHIHIHTHISILWVGFKPIVPAYRLSKCLLWRWHFCGTAVLYLYSSIYLSFTLIFFILLHYLY